MSGFLYYRPGDGLVNLADAKTHAIGYAFDGGTPAGANGVIGPDGGRGTIFADRKRLGEKTIRYVAAEQAWRQIPNSEVWVGYYTDAKPTPGDLARPTMLDGPTMILADEHAWKIPLIRRFDEQTEVFAANLPQVIGLDDEGNWMLGCVVAKHNHLWKDVGLFVDHLCGAVAVAADDEAEDVVVDYTLTHELNTIADLLAANYVVSKAEVAVLGLLAGEAMILEVLMAAADWKTFIAWANSKKNEEPNTPSTEGGPTAA